MTVYCPFCDTANRDGSLYCNNCGQRLNAAVARRCPSCNAANIPQAKFCHNCGTKLPDIVPPSHQETVEEEEEEPLEAELLSLDEALAVDRSYGVEVGTGQALSEEAVEALVARLVAGLSPSPATGLSGHQAERKGRPHESPLPQARDTVPQGKQSKDSPFLPIPEGPAVTAALAVTLGNVEACYQHASTAPMPSGSRLTALSPWIQRLLYLALLMAVAVPFLFTGAWSGSTIPLNPSTARFYETVNALAPGAAVLLAFDYDPGTQAEMAPQARAVLLHLQQKGARLVAMSLLPQGPALAEEALRLAISKQEYRYGENYINLGYLAGEEAALAIAGEDMVAAFGVDYAERRPLSGQPILRDIRGAKDFALVVVFAGEERSARRWLEQIQGRYKVKMAAGVSAAAAPQLEPYLQSGQLKGLLTGLPGAAEYELLLNRPGSAVQMLDAQSLAHLVIVVAILLGNVAYFFRRARDHHR